MIAPKQIGWSQESNLLWGISRQLDRLNSQMCTGGCPTTTTTTTPEPLSLFGNFQNYLPGGSPCTAGVDTNLDLYANAACISSVTPGCVIYIDNAYTLASQGYYTWSGIATYFSYFYVNASGVVVNVDTCPQ